MDKPVLKKFDNIEYWDYGTSDTVFIFLHGNLTSKPNFQNVLSQGPLTFVYGQWRSITDFTLVDTSVHNVRIIVPVNTDVSDTYADDNLVERLVKEPSIAAAKKKVLSGNSYGGKEVCRQIAEGTVEFDAYIVFSPYYPAVPSSVKNKKPTLVITANEDPISRFHGVEPWYNKMIELGVPIEKIWLSRKDHMASSNIFYTPKLAKSMVYDWIDLKVKPNSEPAPSLPKPVGDIYQENGKYFIKLDNGKVAEVLL